MSIICAADYNSDKPCCNQPIWGNDLEKKCPKDKPICTGYIADKTWGNCVQKYKCITNKDGTTNCLISPDGKYNSLKECELDCKPKFSCDPISNTCKYDQNGEFSNIIDCQKKCKPKYKCDQNNYVCVPDHNGNYQNISECSQECIAPLMIPNQNIKQNYLDKELANNTIINGSLNSETLRLKSSSIEFVVYTILAITFISLIGYYMVNNTNNTFTNIVAIIISLLIVFVISKYIYDNYNKPIKI
jgi:hypothetical protein